MKSLLYRFVLSFLSLLSGSLASATESHPVSASQPLDLSGHDLARRPLRLTQGWTFFNQQLVPPHDIAKGVAGMPVILPDNWNSYKDPVTGQIKGALGCGTYAIRLRGLPFREDGYELMLNSVATANRLWLIPEDDRQKTLSLHNGKVACNASDSIPQLLPQTLAFHPTGPDQTWLLLIQVANYHYYKGGMWNPVEIHGGQQASHLLALERHGTSLSIGAIFIIGLYSFMLFWSRREDRASLFLALDCFSAVIRTFSSRDFLAYFYPEPSVFLFNLKYLMDYGMLCVTPLFFMIFVSYMFPEQISRRAVLFFSSLSAIGLVFILATRPDIYGKLFLAFVIMIWSMLCYLIVAISRAYRARVEGSGIVVMGGTVIVFALAHDTLVGFDIIAPPFIAQYGIAFFLFFQSQIVSRRFAKAFRTAERLTRELKKEVESQIRDIRSMLDHIPEGVFTIIPPGIIHNNFSAYLTRIFNKDKIAGQKAVDFIFKDSNLNSDSLSRIETVISSSLNEPVLNFQLNEDHLVKAVDIDTQDQGRKNLQISWNPITRDDNTIEKILVTLRDVTELNQIERQSALQREELDFISELINVPAERFHHFLDMVRKFVSENQRLIEQNRERSMEVLKILFINMHTIKGTARGYSFTRMTGIVHEIEQHYGELMKDPLLAWDQEKLLADLDEVRRVVDTYEDISTNKLGRSKDDRNRVSVDRTTLESHAQNLRGIDMSKLDSAEASAIRNALQLLEKTCFDRARDCLLDIMHWKDKLAKDLGRERPELFLHDPGFGINYEAQMLLRNVFVHLLRNSLDHGIETREERLAVGKKPEGRIEISVRAKDEFVVLDYSDDGRGLNMLALKTIASKHGWVSADQDMDPASTAELIFLTGLSTAETVSEISGRGIGMAAVRTYIENAGGSLSIVLTEPIQGGAFYHFRFEIALPSHFFSSPTPTAEIAA